MSALIRSVLLAVAWFALNACSQLAQEAPANDALSTATEQKVQALIDQTITENGVAGYAIALLADGELVYETLGGFANIEHEVPITPQSRFQIYSASKLFFNMALLQQIEHGVLEPDATLGRYLTDLPEDWLNLTVRQTWSHMTGTSDILDLRGMEPTAAAALASVIDIPLKFPAGTQTEYNQTNYLLLKMVFEEVTKTDYRDYLRKEILEPVGLTALPLGDLNLAAPNLTTNYEAHNYEDGKLGRRSITFPPYVYTSAGINITLGEFVAWWRAVLNEEYVSKETLDTFWKPVLRLDGSPSYRSNGWERQHQKGVLRIGHGGGARIHLFHYIPDAAPEHSVTIIFLNNGGRAFFDHRAFGDDLAAILLKRLSHRTSDQ